MKKYEKYFWIFSLGVTGVGLFFSFTILFGFAGLFLFYIIFKSTTTVELVDILMKSWVFAGTGGYIAQRIWIKLYNLYQKELKKKESD